MRNVSIYEVQKTLQRKQASICIALIIGVLIVTGFIFIMSSPQGRNTAGSRNLLIDTGATDEETEAVKALTDRNVYFAGMDNITADADTVIRLENLKENDDILISYTILDNGTGRELFHTDLIPAGQHVDWKPSESVEAGSYDICYVQNPVWQDGDGNYIPLTSADNMATLTLKG